VKKALDIDDVPTYFWCDSTTALAWIQRNDEWGTFVGNRVKVILKLTEAREWRHVPREMNPADLPSRGCSPSQLVTSRWWEGPLWLKGPEESWPSAKLSEDEEEVRTERKKSSLVPMITTTSECPWYLRKSSYYKNLRIVAWMRRFFQTNRERRTSSTYLSVKELEDAERVLLQQIQTEAFGKEVKAASGIIVT
jgi:hypothetical protein